jgi:glutamate racemase
VGKAHRYWGIQGNSGGGWLADFQVFYQKQAASGMDGRNLIQSITYMVSSSAPIGVFDSGIGGLSILKALRAEMPHERFVYFADSAHNPYGDKSDAFVIDRSRAIARELTEQHGIKALVIACNTATAAAIGILRAEYPELPIIGVEPALKPAIAISRTKRIAVLATPGTLRSAKFLALKASLAEQAEFICTPCDGLADMIEHSTGAHDDAQLIASCASFIRATGQFGTRTGEIDTLVLGCTHYPLVQSAFRQAVGDAVHIVDNGPAVAKRVAALIAPTPVTAPLPGNRVVWLSSDAHHSLAASAARWL